MSVEKPEVAVVSKKKKNLNSIESQFFKMKKVLEFGCAKM